MTDSHFPTGEDTSKCFEIDLIKNVVKYDLNRTEDRELYQNSHG